MLTPVEIQNKSFKASGLGYDKKDVDAFVQDVCDSFEEVYRDRLELEDKVNSLNDALTHYKAIEKTMQKALILAEKTAEETKAAAIENARQIENEAVTKSQAILSDARRELDKINQQIINMVQTFESYKINFKNLANAQIDIINSDAFNLSAGLKFEEVPVKRESIPAEPTKKYTKETKQTEAPALSNDFEIIEGEDNQ